MRVTSARRLVAMAAAVALGSVGILLWTTPAAEATATFSNPAAITINDNANATPYPSPITVSGMAGTITDVTVRLTGFSHEAMADVSVVLVAPNGDAVAVMAGVGSISTDVNNVDLTISDSAASSFSTTTNPASGTYKPASFGASTDVFPPPGPGGAYEHPATDGTATLSSVFGGDAPNGTWNLFVRDFFANDVGSISGGWSLSITTTDHVLDGGFEAAVNSDSPHWTEADSVFGTPLCDAVCGGVGPRSGDIWVWFGGTQNTQTASLTQSVTIPAGGATLSFYLWRSSNATPKTATLTVKMDATVVHTFTEVEDSGYTLRTFDVSAFAGGTHTLSFSFDNPDVHSSPVNFHMDDVSLTSGAPVTTGTPTVTGTNPTSPGSSTTPQVIGTAEAGSTVTLYSNNTCTSAALGTATAATFATPGITVTVPTNVATTIYAQATKSGQVDSACSSAFVYTHDSIAPDPPTGLDVSPASPNQSTGPAIKGTAEAGSTVKVYKTSDCSGPPAATDTAAVFGSSGLLTSVGPNTTTTFKATATDAAGNTSTCSTSSVTYVMDVNPPAPVTLDSVSPSSPDPDTTPIITGTAEAGSTVRLYTTADCTGSPWQTGTAAAFGSTGLTAPVGADSTTIFKATATDAASNTSACSTSSLTYVNDSTAPAPVILTSTTPASPSTSTTPSVAGTAEAGSTVQLYTTAGCTGAPAATGTASAFGSPGLPVTVTANSTTTFKATATDPAGNTSGCSTSSLAYVSDSTAPALVTMSSTTPASPGTSTTPLVAGTAEAGSTVKLYTTAGCTGSPVATGSAAAFFSPGLTATVGVGSTTTFKATATDAAGNISACSTSSVTYVQQNAAAPPPPVVPDTTLTKTPKKKVTTTKSKAKVSFEFSSATAGATFQCSVDGEAFTACTTGQVLKLKIGKHTFAVRAVAAGQTDPTPATYSFKIKRKT